MIPLNTLPRHTLFSLFPLHLAYLRAALVTSHLPVSFTGFQAT